MRIKWLIFFFLLPLPAMAAPLKIVTSFSILGDMAQEVAGENAEITTLVGPGGDAHVYEPTPTDAKAVAGADLVIINGLGFEGWIAKLATASGYKGHLVVASRGIAPLPLPGQKLAQDPHAWQSAENGKIYVANIRDALIKADPPHAADYRTNADRYLEALGAMEEWIKKEIAWVPAAKRRVISSHDAFQYFAKAYGVEFIAPLKGSTDAEPAAADIAAIIDQIRARQVQILFLENITDPRLIHQLEADGHATIGGTLYSDALSPPEGPAASYLALLQHNTETLAQGMQHNNQ